VGRAVGLGRARLEHLDDGAVIELERLAHVDGERPVGVTGVDQFPVAAEGEDLS